MLTINKITLTDNHRIEAAVRIDGNDETIVTEIDAAMEPYVCLNRCDAYVMGFLYTALQMGWDIESEIPISQDLFYNLEYHFLDAMCQADKRRHRIRLLMPVASGVEPQQAREKFVATGISCGIDSLFTVATHSGTQLPDYELTHLAFFDVGASYHGEGTARSLFEGRFENARKFAETNGYGFIFVRSNIHRIIDKYIPYSHVCNNTYMMLFCILSLQRAFSKYYYSSGYSYNEFRLYDPGELDSEHYDLLLLNVASVNGTRFYSTGASFNRMEKTRVIASYDKAYDYLNVCVAEARNDNKCFKCVRTLLSLDAWGGVDRFGKVFDLDYYRKNRNLYIRRMWIDGILKRNSFYREIIPFFSRELTLPFKLKCLASLPVNRVKRLFHLPVKEIKRLIRIMSTAAQSNYDARYDLLKSFTILLVVLGHITIIYSPHSSLPQPNGNTWINLLTDAIYSFHMPLFMFVSGCIYAIGRKRQKYRQLPDLLRNKFRRLMIPYLFIGLGLLIPTLIWLRMTESDYFQSALDLLRGMQVKHLWFLLALFLIFLIVRVSESWMERTSPLVVLTGSVALAVFLPLEKLQFFQLAMVIRFLPYFLLGYYAEKRSLTNMQLRGGEIWLTILAAGVIFLLKVKGNLPSAVYMLTDYMLAILCIVVAMQLIPFIGTGIGRDNRFYNLLSTTSFGIYLLHPMIIYAFFHFKGDLVVSPWLMIPAVFFSALLLSILGTVLLRKLHLRFILGE